MAQAYTESTAPKPVIKSRHSCEDAKRFVRHYAEPDRNPACGTEPDRYRGDSSKIEIVLSQPDFAVAELLGLHRDGRELSCRR